MGISCRLLLSVWFFIFIFAIQRSLTENEPHPGKSESIMPAPERSIVNPETPVYVPESVATFAGIGEKKESSIQSGFDPTKDNTKSIPPTINLPLVSFPLFHPPLVDDVWQSFQRSQQVYSWQLTQNKPLPSADASGKSEEDMPSFEEWRQQKLELVEKEKGNHSTSSNNTGRRLRRAPMKNTNYASAVCGAKVIAHNPELENPGAILTANRDDYMLTPCKVARRFFVVELCERIHVHSFDIGNLELFSATPKKVHVFGAGRFPSRDWVDYGQFTMTETRDVQNFTVPAGIGFVKYIRVEMVEHHGKEHYCPVTVFRVSGTSMMDEYVYSEDSYEDDDDDDPSRSSNPPERINEDAYVESDKWTGDGLLHNVNPITMAKNLVKRFVTSGYNLINPAATNNVSPAPCRNSTGNSSFRPTNITEVALSAERAVGSNHIQLLPSSPLLSLCYDQEEGWNVTTSGCQYVWCLLQASKVSLAFCPSLGAQHPSLPPSSSPSSSYSNLSNAPLSLEVPIISTPVETVIVKPELTPPEERTQIAPSDESVPPSEFSAVAVDPNGVAEANLVSGVSPPARVDPVKDNRPVSAEAEVKGFGDGSAQFLTMVERTSSNASGSGSHAVHETTPLQHPLSNATANSQQGSVFVKLDNRLKILELNMSLSGQYLHELSRRFKKQNEDSVKNFTGVFQKLSDMLMKESTVQATILGQLEKIKREKGLLELQVTLLREEVRLWRWIVPMGCSVFFVLLLVSLVMIIPRYIESTVKRAIQRQTLATVTSNGHLNTKINGIIQKKEDKLHEALSRSLAQSENGSQASITSSASVVSSPTAAVRKQKKKKKDKVKDESTRESLTDRMVPVPDRLPGSKGDST